MYYNKLELDNLGLASIGSNVLIDKTVLIHNPNLVSISNNSRIDAYVILSGKITICKNVHIAAFSFLNGGKLGITVSDFSGFAYGVYAFTSSDDYSGSTLTGPTIPTKFKKTNEKEIIIEKHCIIGARSMIFPGVKLSLGTAIGAMSLVTRSTLPWKIYFGIPAKEIKDRSRDLLLLETEFLNEQ